MINRWIIWMDRICAFAIFIGMCAVIALIVCAALGIE